MYTATATYAEHKARIATKLAIQANNASLAKAVAALKAAVAK